ncbi:MAG: universal stress protein [Myxococcales bacterium]|nr:universal stress protein [Myxococcales bacterium]
MKLKQIIVATDFSVESNAPIRHGIEIARSSGAALLVVHVVETPGDDEALQSAVEHWHADSEARLARQIEACASDDVDVAQEIVDAPSATEGLQSLVDSHRADLVIVGSTGLTGIKHALLGSTAQKALRTVQAHVLVARGETPPVGGYKRILIPTDFSPPAEQALELALALAAPNAQFDLVHCWRVPEATRADEYSELVIDAVAASVKERGRKLLESFRQDAPSATFSSVNQSPERGIAEKLEGGDYDLVVVGSYGRSKLRHWLLGSVAEHTARVAPCAVAVARPDS